jgi:hypothetical protein
MDHVALYADALRVQAPNSEFLVASGGLVAPPHVHYGVCTVRVERLGPSPAPLERAEVIKRIAAALDVPPEPLEGA